MLQGTSLIVVGLLLVLRSGHQHAAGWLHAWAGVNFVVLGAAHFRGWGRLYGKRRNGSLPWWSWLFFLPLHVLTYAVWHLARSLFNDDKFNAVTKEFVVGRRLVAGEHEAGFTNFVDLTAEFRAPAAARAAPNYLSFPILDGGVPTLGELRATLRKLQPGRTYVHCAQGRGRAGLFATVWLLDSGLAATVPDALALLKAARPGIHLNRRQRRCAESFAAELTARKQE